MGLFVVSAVLCTGPHLSRTAQASTRRHAATSSQEWQYAKAPGPSIAVDDSLDDDDDAPSHPGLMPTPRLSALALPLLEPAAPRAPVIARNPSAPRRVKIPAPSTDDVPAS